MFCSHTLKQHLIISFVDHTFNSPPTPQLFINISVSYSACLLFTFCILYISLQNHYSVYLLYLIFILFIDYSGTSPYGHLTSKKTSQLQSPCLSPKLYSIVQITSCNKVASLLRSLFPSPVGDLNSEVPLYLSDFFVKMYLKLLLFVSFHYHSNISFVDLLLMFAS